jgi:hypothetical protein
MATMRLVYSMGARLSGGFVYMTSEFKDGGEAPSCLVGLFTFQLIRSFN